MDTFLPSIAASHHVAKHLLVAPQFWPPPHSGLGATSQHSNRFTYLDTLQVGNGALSVNVTCSKTFPGKVVARSFLGLSQRTPAPLCNAGTLRKLCGFPCTSFSPNSHQNAFPCLEEMSDSSTAWPAVWKTELCCNRSELGAH